jgi:NADPH-dependent F420 reductase
VIAAAVTAVAPAIARAAPTTRKTGVACRQHAQPIARHARPTSASIVAVARVTPGGYRVGSRTMDVAVIGGTGAEGYGLTLRLARAGHHVTIGSRDAERGAAKSEEARALLGSDVAIDGTDNVQAAAGSGIVFVTVPFGGAAPIYQVIAPAVSPDTIVCDCTSPLMSAVGGRASHAIRPWHGSAAEFVKTLLPKGTRLVAAFHTIGAQALQALDVPVDSDAFVMGDDAAAKATIGSLIEDIPGMRWVDVGGLQMARIAETMTPLLISVNSRYKIHEAGFRITGRELWGSPQG